MLIWYSLVTIVALVRAGSDQGRGAKITSVDGDRCTTIVMGKMAGLGGPMTTHTADCSECDFRINKVPARDHPAGAMRPLYEYKADYPSNVVSDRGKTWRSDNLEGTETQKQLWSTSTKITGYIPEVAHTYALFEAGYGIMNEHQVAIGESTCASKLWAAPTTAGGSAMVDARELTRIALERSMTAKEAVLLMGDIAEKYGFYAADWSGGDDSKGEGGEALTVVDPNEAWVFHVLSDDTGTSAVWAAQRVQDDHLAVVANQFIIRAIPAEPTADLLFSSNLHQVAQRAGLWSAPDPSNSGSTQPNQTNQPLDFLTTFAPMRAHSNYATRRVWRVFSLVAKEGVGGTLPPYTDPYANDYPFSVKVDTPLHPSDVMSLNRDHYEGSQFDLTRGLAAGPYGDPQRFDGTTADDMDLNQLLSGSYERAISMFRTSYSFVAQGRAAVPAALALLWFGQYAPHSSTYAPLYVGGEAPVELTRGSLFSYNPHIPFWNFLAVNNYASRFFKYAMVDVKETQQRLESASMAAVAELESAVLGSLSGQGENRLTATQSSDISIHRNLAEPVNQDQTTQLAIQGASRPHPPTTHTTTTSKDKTGLESGSLSSQTLTQLLSDFSAGQVEVITNEWAQLLPRLITKFHDGYIASDLEAEHINMVKLFYPKWWLEATGFFLNKPTLGDGVILFSSNPNHATVTVTSVVSSVGAGAIIAAFLATAVMSMMIGVWLGKRNRASRGYVVLQ